jgi:hypothetical protein
MKVEINKATERGVQSYDKKGEESNLFDNVRKRVDENVSTFDA